MASHKSALKKHRQDEGRRARNRVKRSRMRSQVKKLRAAIDRGDETEARDLLVPTLSIVDRSAKLGVIHGNVADRTKSRLQRAVDRMGSDASA